MADEIELKLDLTREAVDALDAAGFWPGAPVVADQRSTYFDTPDRTLATAGLSLRIRRSGRKRVQTVKAEGEGAGGLFVRPEWERAVRGETPVLDDSNPVRALLGDAVDAVAPAFTVAVERRTWMVADGAASIEMVLDRGEVASGERMTPIHEIELELKEGPPAALFALARRIATVAPVRIGVQTKAERGYRLAEAATPAVKAEAVAMRDDLTAAAAFRLVVAGCLRHYRRNEALLLASRDPDALHQARVALRRLRSAFSIFRPIVGGERQAALRQELRWLAGELGDARNLDVLLDRAAADALHDRLAVARKAAYDHVVAVLETGRVRALMLDLVEWVAIGDWLDAPDPEALPDLPVRSFACAALDRLRRRVKRGGRDLRHADDETGHELRKNAKKLRYGAAFFAALYDAPRSRRRHRTFVAALEDLQDALGALNDLATAPEVIGQLGLVDDPDAARLLHGGKRKTLLASAAEAHDDVVDAKRFWR